MITEQTHMRQMDARIIYGLRNVVSEMSRGIIWADMQGGQGLGEVPVKIVLNGITYTSLVDVAYALNALIQDGELHGAL